MLVVVATGIWLCGPVPARESPWCICPRHPSAVASSHSVNTSIVLRVAVRERRIGLADLLHGTASNMVGQEQSRVVSIDQDIDEALCPFFTMPFLA